MDEYVTSAFSKTKMKEELDHPCSQFYFAQINDDVVGYLKLNCEDAQTEPMGKDAMEIERIYVRLANQGMGIGQRLIDFAKEKGREASMNRIWLGVWEENHRALQFYHRNGFEAFSSHIFTFGDEEQRDLLLEFLL